MFWVDHWPAAPCKTEWSGRKTGSLAGLIAGSSLPPMELPTRASSREEMAFGKTEATVCTTGFPWQLYPAPPRWQVAL